MSDTISRQAAIDAICKACSMTEDFDYHKCYGYPETSTLCDELVALRALPSAQPDLSAYSDKLWKLAYERGKAEAQAEVIRCRDCKHMIEHENYGNLGESAYTCEGNMSGWVLQDSFCSMAKRREDG